MPRCQEGTCKDRRFHIRIEALFSSLALTFLSFGWTVRPLGLRYIFHETTRALSASQDLPPSTGPHRRPSCQVEFIEVCVCVD